MKTKLTVTALTVVAGLLIVSCGVNQTPARSQTTYKTPTSNTTSTAQKDPRGSQDVGNYTPPGESSND